MMSEISQNIEKAIANLINGSLVAIPTETVYGLAGNALNKDTVLKIFETKNRPKFDPLIIHTFSLEEALKYGDIHPDLLLLANKFWPGPLTILAKKRDIVPDIVSSGLPQVAIRVPNHKLTLSLLEALPFPLAAPSANPFGYISPTTAQHVQDQLGGKISMILDGGPCKIGVESTIVGIENDTLVIYRKGGLTVEEIQIVIKIPIKINDSSDSDPLAPGMLKKHYSPNKKVQFLESDQALKEPSGFLRFKEIIKNINPENQFILSEKGNLEEASHRLFEGLRYLDKLPVEYIYLEPVPDIGLGKAINDRLNRAAAKD